MAIRKLSKKRAKQNREYLKLRHFFIVDNCFCQAMLPGCQVWCTEVHHQKGRIGSNLTDVSNFLAVCHSCHKIIEHEPEMAKQNGFSKSRLVN